MLRSLNGVTMEHAKEYASNYITGNCLVKLS